MDKPRRKTSLSLRTDIHRLCHVFYPEPPWWRKRLPNEIQYALLASYTHLLTIHVPDHPFHQSFPATVKHLYRQLLRVFAHIYHAHYQQVLHLRSEPHFNSLFAHFLAFGREYELLEVRDIKGEPNAPVGVGLLWERWKEKGILESWCWCTWIIASKELIPFACRDASYTSLSICPCINITAIFMLPT